MYLFLLGPVHLLGAVHKLCRLKGGGQGRGQPLPILLSKKTTKGGGGGGVKNPGF